MWVRLSQITCVTSAQQFASLVMPMDNRCICGIFRRGLYIPWTLSILVIDIVGHHSSKTEPYFKHSMGVLDIFQAGNKKQTLKKRVLDFLELLLETFRPRNSACCWGSLCSGVILYISPSM